MRPIISEKLPISVDQPIRARVIDYDHFTYPWHFHGEYEIIYIKEGTGRRFVGNSIEPFGPGQLLLLGPNIPHCMQSDQQYWTGGTDLRVKGVIIQFETDFMNHSVSNYPQFNPIKSLLNASKNGLLFPEPDGPGLIRLVEQMPLLVGMNQVIKLLTLLQKMAEVPVKRVLSTPIHPVLRPIETSGKIEKIEAFLSDHYTQTIQLDKVASLASMNPSAFCRFFKTHTGKTVMRYVIELRVGYACKLLMMGTMSISQIALESGFESISNFNRMFKRITGTTPSDYRIQAGK